MGTGVPLPVWVRVSSSKVSSSVPKPPGRHTKAFDSLTSMSLRVKKYFIETSFPSAGDGGVGLLLERQADAHAEAVLAAGPLHRRGHDARAGARDDHPSLAGERAGDVARLGVQRVVLAGVRAEPNTATLGTLR